MSLTDHGGRNRQTIIRQLAQQVAADPQFQSAIMGSIEALLPDVIERKLRDTFAGETVRFYSSKTGSLAAKAERDRRIQALAAPPSSMAPAQIATQEGISLRRVQQILARKIGA